MEITFNLTQADFYRSFIAHRSRNAFSKWLFRLLVPFCWVLISASILGLAFTRNAIRDSIFEPLGFLALLWALTLWGAPWWGARRQFRGQPAARGERKMVIDSAGIHWRWDTGSSDVQWENCVRWVEAKEVILLYSSPMAWGIVPKRAFDESQLKEFRALLTQNVRAAG